MGKIPIHVLDYGDAGTGKSTFAATFPKPMLVCCFDPLGKDGPYLRKGVPGPVVKYKLGDQTVPMRIVKNQKGVELINIVYFHDTNPKVPTCYSSYLAMMAQTPTDAWGTIVIDSITFMELAARKEQQYRLNATARDPRQWWAASTDTLEEQLMMGLAGVQSNVVVIAHVDKDKDEVHGNYVHNPAAPGRLRGRLASAFAEFYRSYIGVDDEGTPTYCLQTRGSSDFNAHTQLGAPNPALPVYSALFPASDGAAIEE